jgi:integrase
LGELPVSEVDTGLVLRALEPIWTAKPETAGRVRSRIESILDWAKVRGYRNGENPARWKGHLDKLLPKRAKIRKVEHHPALPYSEIPQFMGALRGRDNIASRALEFAILTAARAGEVIGATWAEIDIDRGTWTIPAARMKAGAEHRVPLSPRALDILEGVPRLAENPHLFSGARSGKPLGHSAIQRALKDVHAGDAVPHGFRSTFRDWAAEQTAYPNHVVEQALAHSIGDKVEAAYRRGDLFEKRRRLMSDWAEYCSFRPAPGEVIPTRTSLHD